MTTLHFTPAPAVTPSTTRPIEPSARRSILVVDDDPMLRRLIAIALEEEGYDVAQAPDGQTALTMVAEAAMVRPYSLMLLDGQMPVLSGRQVLQRLRADPATATLPVILVTADSALVDRLSGLAAGADDYLTKPFSLEEIVARVKAHLRAHDAWSDTLAAHTRQRTLLARALQAASRQPTLEGAAGVLCNALASQGDVQAAVVVRFTADGQALPVACAGSPLWGLRPGDPAPPSLRRYLSARAAGGPWLERGEAAVGVAERPPALVAGPRVACAPFGDDDGGLHGVLLLELGDGRGGGAVAGAAVVGASAGSGTAVGASAALAAAIDFAAVVEGLLRPRLVEQRRAELDRMELRSVLRERAFRPHFQPIVDLTTGAIVGAEALTRFSDGSNPETRFREAAVLGLGADLELATLGAAVHEAAALLPPTAWISLNVSPALMLSVGASAVRSILDLRDGTREVVLELSEQEAVSDYDSLRSAVQSVGDGVRLSVDDAGSGFASLRHILRLEPDFIKLDRSWVHGVDTDPARQAMIAGLRHFADQTGAQLIAEGIEREEERQTLLALEVDLGQGYLLGRPAPVNAAA